MPLLRFSIIQASCLIGLLSLAAGATVADRPNQTADTRPAGRNEPILTQKTAAGAAGERNGQQSGYHQILRQAETLASQNNQLEGLLARQQRQLASAARQLENAADIRRHLLPLMGRMVEVLEEFVALDIPFLLQQRQARIITLRETLDAAEISDSEKFRRISEAYQVELDYGRTIEAYDGILAKDSEQARPVVFLRIGRLGLYYLRPDGRAAGLWDRGNRAWQRLPGDLIPALTEGIRIARKQAAADMIRLPLPAPELTE